MDTNLQTYTVLVEIVHMTINRVAPSSTVWPCVPVLWSPDIPAVLDRIRWPEERQRSNIHSYFFYLIQYQKRFHFGTPRHHPKSTDDCSRELNLPLLVELPSEHIVGQVQLFIVFQTKDVCDSPPSGRAAEDILHAFLSWRDLSRKDV